MTTMMNKTHLARHIAVAGAIAAVLCCAAALAMPWWAERATQHLAAEFFCILALAQMWNLLVGYGGMVSVGQQLYIGIGAYSLVPLALWMGINPFFAAPLAGLVGALFALPCGVLLFRLRGAHFAVGTWVLAEVFRLLTVNTMSLGGGSGLSVLPAMKGMPVWWRESLTLWTALALGVGACLGVWLLLRSRLGLALTAVRDNEGAAESLGVGIGRIKWIVYVAAAAGCATCGALLFTMKMRISPEAAYAVDWSAMMFFAVVIGGIGSIEGPILGVLVYFLVRQWLGDWGAWYQMVLGLLTIVVMLRYPKGMFGALGIQLFPTRRRPGGADNGRAAIDAATVAIATTAASTATTSNNMPPAMAAGE